MCSRMHDTDGSPLAEARYLGSVDSTCFGYGSVKRWDFKLQITEMAAGDPAITLRAYCARLR